MSSIMGAKAISLVTNGRITERPCARVFEAHGSDGDLYVVTVDRAGDTCTCPAGQREQRCYHVRAAHLLMARDRAQVPA